MLKINNDTFNTVTPGTSASELALLASSAVMTIYTTVIADVIDTSVHVGRTENYVNSHMGYNTLNACELLNQDILISKDIPRSYLHIVHKAIVDKGFTPVYEE